MTGEIPHWRKDAACLGEPTTIFFPERWEVATEARSICARCSVPLECVKYALQLKIEHGIWGGMNVKERRDFERRHFLDG